MILGTLETSFNMDYHTEVVEVKDMWDVLNFFERFEMLDFYRRAHLDFYVQIGDTDFEVDYEKLQDLFRDGTLEPGVYGIVLEYSEDYGRSIPTALLDPSALRGSVNRLKKGINDILSRI